MRFTVDRIKLCEAVTNLLRAVSSKATFPVLEGIYMKAQKDTLNMMSYNLEMGMKKDIEITCLEEGEIVLNARLLGEILRKLSDSDVVIEVDDRLFCKIKSGSAVFDIMGMPASDFPEMPTIEECDMVNFPSELLKDLVRTTIFSIATAEMQKPVYTGLFFDITPSEVSVIGVDGYRLAVRKEKINLNATMKFVISAKTISEAVKIIRENEESIDIFVGRRHLSIVVDGYTIISRKIEGGEFIDYKKIMPSSFSTTVNVNTKDLISIIDRITLIINDYIKSPIRCKIEEEKMVFSSSTAVGRATDSYKVDINGEKFEIGINGRYLVEALKATEVDEVTINFNGPFASIIILPKDNDDFIYMIMPIRIKAD